MRDPENWENEPATIGEPVENPGIIYEIRLDNETADLIGEAARKSGILPVSRYLRHAALETARRDLAVAMSKAPDIQATISSIHADNAQRQVAVENLNRDIAGLAQALELVASFANVGAIVAALDSDVPQETLAGLEAAHDQIRDAVKRLA